MSADFGFGSVSPYEGIGSVAISEVEHVQGEGSKPVTNTWDVEIDIPATEMTSSVMEVQAGDDLVDSWVTSSSEAAESPRSAKVEPSTATGASRRPEPPRNLKVYSSDRTPRLGRPVILDRRARLARPPAARLVSALKWLLTPKAYSRIVAPLLAQEQHEHFEAISRGDEWLARWIVARLYVLIVCNALRAVVVPIVQIFRSAN